MCADKPDPAYLHPEQLRGGAKVPGEEPNEEAADLPKLGPTMR